MTAHDFQPMGGTLARKSMMKMRAFVVVYEGVPLGHAPRGVGPGSAREGGGLGLRDDTRRAERKRTEQFVSGRKAGVPVLALDGEREVHG